MIYKNNLIKIVQFERNKYLTEKYRSWFNDPETTRYNSWGLFPYTKGQMEDFISIIEKGSTTKIVWAICLNDAHEKHIGNVSLQGINLHNHSAELAIVIGEATARGKGFGLQACQLVLNHGFNKIGLNRIWTGTAATNIPMQKVCEKLGMRQEGIFREGIFLNGEYVDVYAYGILKKEWEGISNVKP